MTILEKVNGHEDSTYKLIKHFQSLRDTDSTTSVERIYLLSVNNLQALESFRI